MLALVVKGESCSSQRGLSQAQARVPESLLRKPRSGVRMQPRAQALGGRRNCREAPKGRQKLLPDVPLIVGDFVLLQESDVFLLEGQVFVVILLSCDVAGDRRHVGFAHAERTVAVLPRKILIAIRAKPAGGIRLDDADDLGCRMHWTDTDEHVNVICHAADDEGCSAGFADDATKIREKIIADFASYQRSASLGTEDEVNDEIAGGLGHVSFAPSELGLLFRLLAQGLGPQKVVSLEAASECSPGREPWVAMRDEDEPRRGDRRISRKRFPRSRPFLLSQVIVGNAKWKRGERGHRKFGRISAVVGRGSTGPGARDEQQGRANGLPPFFRSFGAGALLRLSPRACALGCILAPLRG